MSLKQCKSPSTYSRGFLWRRNRHFSRFYRAWSIHTTYYMGYIQTIYTEPKWWSQNPWVSNQMYVFVEMIDNRSNFFFWTMFYGDGHFCDLDSVFMNVKGDSWKYQMWFSPQYPLSALLFPNLLHDHLDMEVHKVCISGLTWTDEPPFRNVTVCYELLLITGVCCIKGAYPDSM